MSLVRVWTDVGSRKPIPLLAKIVEENGVIFTIRYLSESDDKIWRYEEDTYEIDNDSISEYLKTHDEQDVGFKIYKDGFLKIDSDEDYVPSSSDEMSDEEDDDEEHTEEVTETDEDFTSSEDEE